MREEETVCEREREIEKRKEHCRDSVTIVEGPLNFGA
jgi:hypothetical protein